MEQNRVVLLLAEAIEATFTSSDWTQVAYLTDSVAYVKHHGRLLRSLNWRDNDYRGHVIDAVAHILEKDDSNLTVLLGFPSIADWLEKNHPSGYRDLHGLAGKPTAEVVPFEPQTCTQVAMEALRDSRALLEHRGAPNAVDRVHTAFHAYLKEKCQAIPVTVSGDPSPGKLLNLLMEHHPAITGPGPHREQVRHLLRTAANIIDSLGTLRNHASAAHPNPLLTAKEARLAINLAYSILGYLDDVLEESPV